LFGIPHEKLTVDRCISELSKKRTEVTGTSSVEAELKRLREQDRQLIMERDILKKATAFFAKAND
jgi:transposase-like protein